MRFSDFAKTDLRDFSIYACTRTIPSIIDGLKVPQRKALFGVLHHGGQTTVARMSNHASEVTSFTHGEENMGDTMVNMGKDYAGSNNMPLIQKAGQYGTRLDNEPSAHRYIKASIHKKNYDLLFSKDDEPLLQRLFQEEQWVEPMYYLPCLPLCLINGASGIGVGYGTNILQHSVTDVLRAVREVIAGGKVKTPLIPHLEGYKGRITRALGTDQIEIRGEIEVVDRTTLRITEVPPKWDRKKYRAQLNNLMKKEFAPGHMWVRSYTNNSKDDKGWDIVVKVPMAVTQLGNDALLEAFKLIERNTQNVVLWDVNGSIKSYPNVEAVVEEFVPFRIAKYAERKISMLKILRADMAWNDLKVRFIQYWNDHSQTLVKLPRAGWLKELTDNLSCTQAEADKLLEMNISSLTKERLESLVKANEKMYGSIQELEQTAPAQIWVNDLKQFK
uniref:DNA topoisomerase (ATP-hydrolyzing) n=1 Tax=Pseudomonas phage Cygsa01 TaxID=3138529 RepID=A0AAU6W3A5_9VIRU